MEKPRREGNTDEVLSGRKRRRLLHQETEFLVRVFEQCPRPTTQIRDYLAARLGMSGRNIQIWFQNRRAKVKRDFVESHGKTMLLFAPHSDTPPAVPSLLGNLQDSSMATMCTKNSASLLPNFNASLAPILDPSFSFLGADSDPRILPNQFQSHGEHGDVERLFQCFTENSELEDTGRFMVLSAEDESVSMSSPPSFDPFSDESVFDPRQTLGTQTSWCLK
jgi:hypothetical protein